MTDTVPQAASATTTGTRPTGTRRPPQKRRRTPRRPVALTPIDVVLALVSALSSISFCWLTFSVLTDGIGWFGFWVVAYVIFLAIYFVVTLDRVGRLAAVDRLVTVIAWTAMIVVLVPLVWLIIYILAKGLPALSLGFFVHTQKGVVPTDPATAGGGLHAIVGTIEQVGIALVISLPLGVMTAIFLNETRSKLRRPVRIFVDAMSGMPSVVSGLFIYATLIIPLAKDSSLFGYNGFMAVTGAVGDHDADHLPGRRGGAPSGAGRPQRSRPGLGVVSGQSGLVGGLADGLVGGGDGRHLGHRPRSR